MTNLQLLNALASAYCDNLELNQLKPFEFLAVEDGVKVIDDDEMAFNLHLPIAGMIKDIRPGREDNRAAVVRLVVGYNMVSRIAANPAIFPYHFSMIINAALIALAKKIGDLSFRKVHVRRPGKHESYFRELEDVAAYELRFYVEKDSSDSTDSQ